MLVRLAYGYGQTFFSNLTERFFHVLQVLEVIIDYTDEACKPTNSVYSTCLDFLKNNTGKSCQCNIQFQLKDNFTVLKFIAWNFIIFLI